MPDADDIGIRQARPDDLEAIAAVTAEVFRPFSMEAHIQEAVGNAGGQDWLRVKTAEIERDMRLMGVASVSQLSRENLRFR